MATLSGQTIQSTYQGLLKLADSTTGVTSTAQAVQDGLGNDTGAKIATNYFTAPNIFNIKDFKNDYYGPGFTTVGISPVALQNVINAFAFYDNGMYDYSAITYNLVSATTIGDTFECAFYSAQQINGLGIGPYQPIMTGITLTITGTTGLKTVALPSTLSFSGTGPGLYYFVYKVTNSGATPTFRLTSQLNTPQAIMYPKLGYALTVAGTATQTFMRSPANNPVVTYSGMTAFPSSFTQSDFNAISTTFAGSLYGFALAVTRP